MSRRLTVMPPLSPAVYLGRRHALPFPLAEDHCTVLKLGRHCLWQGLRSIGLHGGIVLTPAYHHGSEIEVLLRSGLELRFYDVDESLEPMVDDVDLTDVRALYLIHYLGFPQNVAFWREWCNERNLLLIEDVAQGWLGTVDGVPLGSWGDIAIFCLYKQLAVPDGGAVVSRSPIESRSFNGRVGVRRLIRRHTAWVTARSALAGRLAPKVVDRPKEEVAQVDFEMGDPNTPPVRATEYLLPRLVSPGVAAQRREHYEFYLRELGDIVAPGFDRMPEGASPFAFPIAVEGKDDLYHYLVERMILVQDLWAVSHPELKGDFPGANRRRMKTIALPVHQDLRRSDIESVVDAVRTGITSFGARTVV